MTPRSTSSRRTVPLAKFPAPTALLVVAALALWPHPSSARSETPADLVLYAADAVNPAGTWQKVNDTSAAGGARLWQPDAGVGKPATASPAPRDCFELTFQAEAGRPYRLWLRGQAQGNSYANDSVFVQFSGSVDASGAPTFRIGSSSSTTGEQTGTNSPPVAKAVASMNGIWGYEQQFQDMPDPNTYLFSDSTDPDGDPLGYEWRDSAGTIVSTTSGWTPLLPPGTHTFTLSVRDGHGGESQDTVTVTVRPFEEIVIGTGYKENVIGPSWERVEVPRSNGSTYVIVRDTDTGAPKVNAPFAAPSSYAEFTFPADPTLEYKLWIRLSAHNNHWTNDSLWVQFTGSTDAAGNAAWKTGTTSGLAVNLEECGGCGLSGWGWRDDAWGTAGAMSGTLVRFPQGGLQTIRIQTREDGVSVDQIVLSARKYKSTRPGAVKNDTTMLPMTAFWGS